MRLQGDADKQGIVVRAYYAEGRDTMAGPRNVYMTDAAEERLQALMVLWGLTSASATIARALAQAGKDQA